MTKQPRKLQAPIDEIRAYIRHKPYIDANFDSEVFRFLGIFILPNFFTQDTTSQILDAYKDKSDAKRVPFHPTRVELSGNTIYDRISTQEKFRSLMTSGHFFEGNVAVDAPQVFHKNRLNPQKVILHNDLDYLSGSKEAYSLFFALTQADSKNGGLIVYPATHHFNSLGDAGELRHDALPPNYPKIKTKLNAGDLLIMNSATWHYSDVNTSGIDRVYVEIKIRNANDPTSGTIVSGIRSSKFRNELNKDEIFADSRESKLRRLYKYINKIGE